MKNSSKKDEQGLRSFEQRLLDLRFKNSKERDYLFGEDEKKSSKKSKSGSVKNFVSIR